MNTNVRPKHNKTPNSGESTVYLSFENSDPNKNVEIGSYIDPKIEEEELKGSVVNIKYAIRNYKNIHEELSTQSHLSCGKSYRKSDAAEKGEINDFDLTEFLSEQNDQDVLAGVRPKNLGLIWKDLVVQGLGADAKVIPTNYTCLIGALKFWNWGRHSGTDFTILKENNGFCKDGEMLLVLGRPGSGCSTLLRVLANMRASYTNIEGTVEYCGIPSEEFSKKYSGEVCYNEEEDLHYPTLTTKQTLQFALKNKTPGKRIEDESKKEFVDKILYMLGNMLGLSKKMDTMVGDAFVRGLSGGERKRLSIAEQMTTRSSINCWDCSTRGLDASSALDYVRSLRIMTDILRKTTVATLYQASDSMFNLFDKVMVLDEGRCIYFGPTSQAKGYFEEMGFHCPDRKSTPDFLTGLCNMNEREYREGYKESVPINSVQFEKVYKESHLYTQMMQERDEYEELVRSKRPDKEFRQAFVDSHQKHTLKSSPFIATYYQQVKALTIRQWQLIWGDKGALITRYGNALIQGVVIASTFYQMPKEVIGTFSRSSALFFCLLFNVVISQAELPMFMQGRRILQKHKRLALYHPSAFYISQVVVDIPFVFVQNVILALCVYFIMGLALTAGKFFSFLLIIIITSMCMNGFFRFYGALSPNFYIAAQLSSIVVMGGFVYSGYQIPYVNMRPWFSWVFWINPIAYSYKALISNEMSGLIFSCEGTGSIPNGPSYTNDSYKTCTLPGAVPGETSVLGDSFLRNAYGYEAWQLWINVAALFILFFFYTIATALIMEYVEFQKEGSSTKIYKAGRAPKEIDEKKALEETMKNDEEAIESISTGASFSWHNIGYSIPTKSGPAELLKDVSGIVKPGHLTALMGASGAGKTTLLDVLAQRKTIGKVEGQVCINGEGLGSDFKRTTGYCEQIDVHNPYATVREALKFSAYLRQPSEVPKEEKDAYVEQIIRLMEMEKISDALIGNIDEGTGISVEERKRLTIAVELVGKPKLLFLDEPTSGLDAQSSYNIIRFIRKLADAGWPVLCTIHQPSATLFEHFDHLALLVCGGKTAYFGEIGADASTMISYFEKNGAPPCAPNANPAEYILECVGAGTAGKAAQDWSEVWSNSKENRVLEEELEGLHLLVNPNHENVNSMYSLSFFQQFWLVYKRMNVSWWRCPSYNLGRAFNVCFVGLLNGFSFWKLGNTASDLQDRMFSIFATFFFNSSLIILVQPKFMQERTWFRREYASSYYSLSPFVLSCLLVEIPYLFVYTAILMSCFYWSVGINSSANYAGFFFVSYFALAFYSVTLGLLVAALSNTLSMAANLNAVISSFLYLFSGVSQPPSALPHFWRSWTYDINPYHYALEGLISNVMHGVKVVCDNSDLIRIPVPSGLTCGNYMSDYFTQGGIGYVVDNSTIGHCDFCNYKDGSDYYETRIGWSFENRWRNFGILWAFCAFNAFVFFGFVYLSRKNRR
ncbi:ABC-2 type transporter-domain-containing protein [Sporodiniella umbellata]|nr:ABC-2 type transporter-domain-containing protein [Sporodiniella umbellata]